MRRRLRFEDRGFRSCCTTRLHDVETRQNTGHIDGSHADHGIALGRKAVTSVRRQNNLHKTAVFLRNGFSAIRHSGPGNQLPTSKTIEGSEGEGRGDAWPECRSWGVMSTRARGQAVARWIQGSFLPSGNTPVPRRRDVDVHKASIWQL